MKKVEAGKLHNQMSCEMLWVLFLSVCCYMAIVPRILEVQSSLCLHGGACLAVGGEELNTLCDSHSLKMSLLFQEVATLRTLVCSIARNVKPRRPGDQQCDEFCTAVAGPSLPRMVHWSSLILSLTSQPNWTGTPRVPAWDNNESMVISRF